MKMKNVMSDVASGFTWRQLTHCWVGGTVGTLYVYHNDWRSIIVDDAGCEVFFHEGSGWVRKVEGIRLEEHNEYVGRWRDVRLDECPYVMEHSIPVRLSDGDDGEDWIIAELTTVAGSPDGITFNGYKRCQVREDSV